MTDRRTFLRGMASLSAAAIPVVAQAAELDEWDRVAAGMAIIHPSAPRALAHARADGRRPDEMTTLIISHDGRSNPKSDNWPCLLFYDENDVCHGYRPKGKDRD